MIPKIVLNSFLIILLWSSEGVKAQDKPNAEEKRNPEEWARFCVGLMQRNFNDLAEKEMVKFLEKNPKHALATDMTFQLISCYQKQKKYQEAYDKIESVLAQNPRDKRNNLLLMQKGQMLLEEKRFQEALEIFEGLQDDPNLNIQESAIFYGAHAAYQMKKIDKAVLLLEKIADKDFAEDKSLRRVYAARMLAVIMLKQHHFEVAEKILDKICKSPIVPDSIKTEAYLRICNIYYQTKRYKEGIKICEKILVAYPQATIIDQIRNMRVQFYLANEEFARVIEIVNEQYAQHPDRMNPTLDYCLGCAMMGVKRFEEANIVFQRLLQMQQVGQQLKVNVKEKQIACFLRLKKYDKVVDEAQKILSIQKQVLQNNEIAYYLLYAWLEQQQFTQIITFIQEKKECKNPKDPFYFYIMQIYISALAENSQFDQAISTCLQIVKNLEDKEKISILFLAGKLAQKGNRKQQAIECFEQILKETTNIKNITSAKIELWKIYAESQNYEKARDAIEDLKAQGSLESQAKIQWLLGWTSYEMEQYDRAVKELKNSIEKKDQGEEALHAQLYLAVVYSEQEKTEEALTLLKGIFSQKEENWPTLEASLMISIAQIFAQNKQFDYSEKLLRYMIKSASPDLKRQGILILAQDKLAQNDSNAALLLLENEMVNIKDETEKKSKFATYYVLLGEIYSKQKENDKAVNMYQKALTQSDIIEPTFLARARWGLAQIYFGEGKYQQASQIALQSMILDKDNIYTPRAMAIAIKSHVKLGEMGQAEMVWREMKDRYPLFAETIVEEGEVKLLLEWKNDKKNKKTHKNTQT